MNGDSGGFRRKLTSYGRRKGKTLRTHHRGLMDNALPGLLLDPELLPSDPDALFDRRYDDIWLEVGFGGGEHLAAEASRNPGIGFIGCEPFQNGVAKLLALIEEQKLQNVRIFPGDAREVIGALPPASLGQVSILYPDPWPKTRQKKRRFISEETLLLLAKAMKEKSELRFATDIDDYSAWTLSRIARSPHFDWPATGDKDWLVPWPHWTSTRYEAKALREGRNPAYFTFVRNSEPV